jgi:glutathione synthase/RimK-type ligase-like ATP-grasp enzyme
MILIIGQEQDAHVHVIRQRLHTLGVKTLILDLETSTAPSVRTTITNGLFEVFLYDGDRYVSTDEITSIWLRRLYQPKLSPLLSDADATFARDELNRTLRALWPCTSSKRWVNPFHASRDGEQKPYQLQVASRIGLRIPNTVITADPVEAVDFCRANNGDIIYKPLAWYGREEAGKWSMIYTNRLTEALLIERFNSIRLAPCIFQEYVPKQIELRAVVIGRTIITVAFDSQASEYSKVDWRRYDFDNVAHTLHSLPVSFESKLLQFMEKMNLVFGCIDLILTPSGEYVFLEVNQAGNWLWLDHLAGANIGETLAAYLANTIHTSDSEAILQEEDISG